MDAYLRTFDKLLILRHYVLPLTAMVRVLGHGPTLIEEYLALADKHFPTGEAMATYLKGRRIALEDTG